MAADALPALKAASVFIRSPDGSTGSGYVVAPGRIGTALHVVRSWAEGQSYDVLVGFGATRRSVKARLLKSDATADAAVLAVDGDFDVPPLPVAAALDRKTAWDGYGYPALANKIDSPPGLPIDGHVQDPAAQNDTGQPAVLLYSDVIAAGQASPLHGFSGSPVVVGGALVGHLVKHIGDVDDRRRAAYGYVYACPIAAVTALLDVPPQQRAIAAPALVTASDAVPALGPGEYHVFISYRSTDRAWAMSLVARLEGAGLRVFIDQKELEPGQSLSAQLESAMQRSRAAVVLVSAGWLASPWCQQESQVFTKRAVEDRNFTLVPLRLDSSQLPPLLDERYWLDFNGTAQAEGPMLETLVNTLLRRAAPKSDTPQAKADTAERQVTDEFVARVRNAVLSDAGSVKAVLAEWRKTASSDAAPLIAAAEVLNGKGWYEAALEVIQDAPRTVRTRQLGAFAKRKLGRRAEALDELEALRKENALDAETAGLLAGTYKAHWLESGDLAFQRRAYEAYREAYERSADPFNGINAAAMALQCGDEGKMHEFAGRLITDLSRDVAKLDYWGLASLAEAYLLKKRFDDARDWYGRAVAGAAGLHADIAIMRRQARRNLDALGQPSGLLDATLPVPRVLAYTGHRTDAPDRQPPRFPESKVGAVRLALRDRLKRYGTLHGFGGAAAGTDILVLKELAARTLTATVVLPFPKDDFVAVSVGGGLWKKAFDELQRQPGIEFTAPLQPALPPPGQRADAFAASNGEIQRLAIDFAKRLDEVPLVLAVWDGKPGDGPGGTADAVNLWQFEGYEVDVIDVTKL